MPIGVKHRLVICSEILKKFPALGGEFTGDSENGLIRGDVALSCAEKFEGCLQINQNPPIRINMGEVVEIMATTKATGCRFCVREAIDEDVKLLLKI